MEAHNRDPEVLGNFNACRLSTSSENTKIFQNSKLTDVLTDQYL